MYFRPQSGTQSKHDLCTWSFRDRRVVTCEAICFVLMHLIAGEMQTESLVETILWLLAEKGGWLAHVASNVGDSGLSGRRYSGVLRSSA